MIAIPDAEQSPLTAAARALHAANAKLATLERNIGQLDAEIKNKASWHTSSEVFRARQVLDGLRADHQRIAAEAAMARNELTTLQAAVLRSRGMTANDGKVVLSRLDGRWHIEPARIYHRLDPRRLDPAGSR